MSAPASVPGAAGSCGDWRGKLRADFANPFAPRFSGSFPLGCGERVWYLSALEHSEYFEAVFRALWSAQGGVWRGRLRQGPAPAGARVVATHESPPLALAIRDVNKFSNNVMARHLFLALGAAASGTPALPATTQRGASAVRAWLATQGLDTPELVLDNGSGLSRRERISANTMARLLTQAYRNPYSAEFMASLPISGVDGTLKDRDIVRGAAHLKTGLLQDSRSLAGYVTSRSGRRYVLVAMLNHANANSGAAQRAQETLVNWLYEAG
jgi:D-alanyl-D-alanine carboxypeptidase/D-alanyl-D-alanine-endopeptidase (penicillin-binding protein 4)